MRLTVHTIKFINTLFPDITDRNIATQYIRNSVRIDYIYHQINFLKDGKKVNPRKVKK